MIRERRKDDEEAIKKEESRIDKCFIRGKSMIVKHFLSKKVYHFLLSHQEIMTSDQDIIIRRA